MGWYYRKRRGAFTFSLSRSGPRISAGLGGRSGCLIACLLVPALAVALAWIL